MEPKKKNEETLPREKGRAHADRAPRFNTSPRRLATVKEACDYGNFSRTFLYRRLGDQTIQAYKRGSRTMIDLNSIDSMNESLQPWTPRDSQKQRGTIPSN